MVRRSGRTSLVFVFSLNSNLQLGLLTKLGKTDSPFFLILCVQVEKLVVGSPKERAAAESHKGECKLAQQN